MSGLSRTPGKRVWVNSPPRVRIPPSPPAEHRNPPMAGFLLPQRRPRGPPAPALLSNDQGVVDPRCSRCRVKNIEIISGSDHRARGLFAATDDEFAVLFRPGENFAFLERLARYVPKVHLYATLSRVLGRPVI